MLCPRRLDESAHGRMACGMKETGRNEGAINRQVYKLIEVVHIIQCHATLKTWQSIAARINRDAFQIHNFSGKNQIT